MADNDQHEILRIRDHVHDLDTLVQATVTKHATMAISVEHLVEGFREHREDSKIFMRETVDTLRKIQEQTTKTNGRVDGHDREFADLKKHRVGTHEQRRASDTANAITINVPINSKTIIAIFASALAIAVMGWKSGLFAGLFQ